MYLYFIQPLRALRHSLNSGVSGMALQACSPLTENEEARQRLQWLNATSAERVCLLRVSREFLPDADATPLRDKPNHPVACATHYVLLRHLDTWTSGDGWVPVYKADELLPADVRLPRLGLQCILYSEAAAPDPLPHGYYAKTVVDAGRVWLIVGAAPTDACAPTAPPADLQRLACVGRKFLLQSGLTSAEMERASLVAVAFEDAESTREQLRTAYALSATETLRGAPVPEPTWHRLCRSMALPPPIGERSEDLLLKHGAEYIVVPPLSVEEPETAPE